MPDRKRTKAEIDMRRDEGYKFTMWDKDGNLIVDSGEPVKSYKRPDKAYLQ
jgi:hypothetical protein